MEFEGVRVVVARTLGSPAVLVRRRSFDGREKVLSTLAFVDNRSEASGSRENCLASSDSVWR